MKLIPVLLAALFALAGQPGRAVAVPVASQPSVTMLFRPDRAAPTQSVASSATQPAVQVGSTPPPAFTPDTATVARTYAIDDVEITARGRIRRLGRRVENVIFSCGGPNIKIGDELGVPCDAQKRTLKLGTLRIWCHTRCMDSLVLRLHLYPLENGVVGERFAIAPIDLWIPTQMENENGETQNRKNNWNDNTTTSRPVSFDLRPYDLHVTGEFLLAIECVNFRITTPQDTGKLWGLWFNARLFAPTYSRTAADPAWGVDKIGIGMTVEGVPASPGAAALGS